MGKRIMLAAFVAAISACSAYAQSKSADSLRCWMKTLSSDEMKGRRCFSAELDKAALWISEKYKENGVVPLKGKSDYFQEYGPYEENKMQKNVVGYIPARVKSKGYGSFILLSAHYDHIGVEEGSTGDIVYNGADDDASGIVMLLGIAKEIKDRKLFPDCAIVLVAYSGEEIGLEGSRAFCESKLLPFSKARININFEMVGHSTQFGKHKFYITGQKESKFGDFLNQYNRKQEWKLVDLGDESDYLYTLADNYSFVAFVNNDKVHIPAHTLATSTGEEHMHTVKDEWQYVDYDNLQSLVRYMANLVVSLSKSNVRLSKAGVK